MDGAVMDDVCQIFILSHAFAKYNLRSLYLQTGHHALNRDHYFSSSRDWLWELASCVFPHFFVGRRATRLGFRSERSSAKELEKVKIN